jgi:hypothetical protein
VRSDPLTDQTAGIDNPPDDFTKGLASSFIANQSIKVPQVLSQWGLPSHFLCHVPDTSSAWSLYYTILAKEAVMIGCQPVCEGFRSESEVPGISERGWYDVVTQILGQALLVLGWMSLRTVFWRQLRSG